MDFSKNVKAVSPSITLELNSKAIELQKQGIDIVKLTAGEPDFPTPEEISESAYTAMKENKTKYTDAKGIVELRKEISQYLLKRTGNEYSPDQIVVTNGGKQALYNVLLAIINKDDEVMMLDPSWVSYEAQIQLVGGTPVHVPLDEEDNFLPTYSKLKKYVSSKTKSIIINSPNNPTGVVYPQETLEVIAEFAKEHDLLVISDEVYELLIFEGSHYSISSIEGMKDRTVIINAFSKTWSMTGWRIGYCTGPADLMKQISKIQSHTTSNVNTPTQYAAITALNVNVLNMYNKFKERRDYVSSRLKKINLNFVEPKGAFYFFINIAEFGMDDVKFTAKLLEEAKVAVVPGSGFYKEGYIRISVATSDSNLEKALDRIEEFVNNLRYF